MKALVNVEAAKLASGRVWQEYALVHSDGASTIHSAELVSTVAAWSVFVTRWRRVASYRDIVTRCPLTVTEALIMSPAWSGK